MNRKLFTCTLTVCMLTWYGQSGLSQTSNRFITNSLDTYITNAMQSWKIPGVAVAIIKDDTLVYSKGFGVRDLSHSSKTDPQTLFPIWSMGKSFTAFSLALLEDRKKVQLDDHVKKHFPEFKMKNPEHEKEMRLIDLLAHRMGVETFQGDFLWSESTLRNEALLQKWSKFPSKYPVRSGFQYSNFGYLIAGKVIEKVAKQDWQSFISNEIINVLDMRNTVLTIDVLNQKQNVAKGHIKQEGKMVPLAAGESMKIEAFGGMYASVEDMIQWIRLHLNKGRMGSLQKFNEDLFDRVHRPYNIVGKLYLPDGSSPNVNYGLGWEVRDYQHREVITHGGAYAGFATMMGFVPKEKLGFVILTNSDAHELGEALKWQIIDSYLNRPYQNYAESMYRYTQAGEQGEAMYHKMMQDSVALQLATPVPISHYAGTYENPVYGKIRASVNGTNALKLTFEHHPQLSAVLKYIGHNRFWCEYSQSMFGKVVFPFQVSDQTVTGFELSVHPYVEFTTYPFTKIRK